MAKKGNKALVTIVIIFGVLIVILAGIFGYVYVDREVNGIRFREAQATIEIEKTDFQYDVGQMLQANDIIQSATIWYNWMDKHYPDFVYINGEYNFDSTMSYEEIAQKLQNPDVSHKTVSVCIPEGYNVFDIAKTLDENGVCGETEFLDACKSADGYDYDFLKDINTENVAYQLEGFLFPATYDFAENSNAKDIVDQMLYAFESRITDSWNNYCQSNNMTLYELVTLASVVEKETLGQGVAENIASVFINRLNKPQKLQSDVTIDYGNLLREAGFDNAVVTSYNTYKCSALPSGPICNPGVANIDAVVNHNDTDYMYFFSYNNGADFYFTDSYEDFSAQWAKLGSTNTNN